MCDCMRVCEGVCVCMFPSAATAVDAHLRQEILRGGGGSLGRLFGSVPEK